MPATRRRVWQPPFPRRAVCQSLEAEDGSVRSPWISPVAFPIENEVHVLHLRGKHRAFCVHGAVPPPVPRVAGRLRGDCVEFRRPTPGLRASDVDFRGTCQPRQIGHLQYHSVPCRHPASPRLDPPLRRRCLPMVLRTVAIRESPRGPCACPMPLCSSHRSLTRSLPLP